SSSSVNTNLILSEILGEYFMKKTALAVVIVLALPLALISQNPPAAPAGQTPAAQAPAAPAPGANPLADYTRQIKYEGLTLSVVLINSRTAEVLFQPPMKYSMRARSAQQTVLYVQGTPQKDFDLTTGFSIEQEGQTMQGTATSIKNFVNGKVPAGQRIDGI